jgi:Starch-binding associating with outer membrane
MNQIKKLFIYSFVAMITFSSCKKFVDINNDPNNNQSTTANFVMTGALGTTYRNQASTNVTIVPGTWTGVYAHSTSFTGGGNDKTYEFTPADYNAFAPLFDNLTDYQYVITNADKDGVSYWKDPANVMQCYVYQQLVDMYGDVPYEDAFKGVANITPKYTSQKVIYEDLVVRLDSAMDRMSRTVWPTSSDFTVQDIYFGLNKTSWIQFANTLKLRILMRQSFVGGATDAYIQAKAVTRLSNGFLTANVLVQPGYQNISGKLNPFYANFGYNEINNVASNYQYRKMNAVLINYLKSSGGVADTFRLQSLAYPAGSTFATPASSIISITAGTTGVASYVGVPLGVGSGFATAGASPIGPFQVQVGSGTRAGMLMLLAESKFLQAEFTERYGVTFSGLSARALFEEGIRDHFRTVASPSTAGNTANPVADGFSSRYYSRLINNVNYVTSTDKIRAILLQKWISLTHINGLEQWSDYRKASGSGSVGVPASVKTTATTSNPEPVRYLYPQGEFDNNGNNVPKNIDRFTSKIFWDVN